MLEMGAGAGNTFLPLLASNENPNLSCFACDYASTGINVIHQDERYTNHSVGDAKAFTWDITSSELPDEVMPGTVDVMLCVFVLSALHPREWETAKRNIFTLLKPGGSVYIRDYGLYDLAQLRMKKDRLLDEENLYCRGGPSFVSNVNAIRPLTGQMGHGYTSFRPPNLHNSFVMDQMHYHRSSCQNNTSCLTRSQQ